MLFGGLLLFILCGGGLCWKIYKYNRNQQNRWRIQRQMQYVNRNHTKVLQAPAAAQLYTEYLMINEKNVRKNEALFTLVQEMLFVCFSYHIINFQ